MANAADPTLPALEESAAALPPAQLAVLVPLALALRAFAWTTIHFRGPAGAFVGTQGVITYTLTIVLNVRINWLHLKPTGRPKARSSMPSP